MASIKSSLASENYPFTSQKPNGNKKVKVEPCIYVLEYVIKLFSLLCVKYILFLWKRWT